jgi:glycosyltransferase involved in cell wall biosynthesis
LLHVGGGQWYKNTVGVVLLYAHYARAAARDGAIPVDLWLVGPPPSGSVRSALAEVPAAANVRFFSGLDNKVLQALYSSASALLFPSLAEGFGWPIVEALACGCPVVTTDEAPMSEVGGDVATYLPRMRHTDDPHAWAADAARVLIEMLSQPASERERRVAAGVQWSQRFSADAAIDHYLSHYERVLQIERSHSTGV